MAKAKGLFHTVGSLKVISMYTMRGSDEVIVRTKGGPSKSTIKRSASCANVRLNNNEWKGCTLFTRKVRLGLRCINQIEDYAVCGALNAIAKSIQKEDAESPKGERNVLLSQHKERLLGFPFSKKQTLQSVLRIPFESTIDRENCSASVSIPAFTTDLHLYNYQKLPYFRVVTAFAMIPDIMIEDHKKWYNTAEDYYIHLGENKISDWISSQTSVPALQFDLQFSELNKSYMTAQMTLILVVGVEFGNTGYNGSINPVKYAGCANIIRVG